MLILFSIYLLELLKVENEIKLKKLVKDFSIVINLYFFITLSDNEIRINV